MDKPLALEAYEQLAEAYAARVDTKPHNAYYERPATLSLLPDVTGSTVLDAGCGPGAYTGWLVQHGARVVVRRKEA
jgi:2-polyprenyl-3-methyl-5-hydroxy-6-metoxy-1,4-benzoquinol methylase